MSFGNFSNALLKRRFLIITETVIVNPDCCSSFPLSSSFSFLLSSFLLLKVEDTAVDIRNYYNAWWHRSKALFSLLFGVTEGKVILKISARKTKTGSSYWEAWDIEDKIITTILTANLDTLLTWEFRLWEILWITVDKQSYRVFVSHLFYWQV